MFKMQEYSDQQLISNYLKGDEKSLDLLVKRYLNQIYGFVFKYVNDKEIAEDITQETFLKVWRNLKKVDKNKSFKSWIYTIAKNTALDFLKKKKSVPFSRFERDDGKNILFDVLPDKRLLPDKVSELLELKKAFLSAIAELSIKYKTVLSLYYYQYLNFREISEVLEEPINTIKSRHRRGLVLLKGIIQNQCTKM